MPNVIANNWCSSNKARSQINTLRLRYADTFGGANAGQAPLTAAACSGNGAADC